jgi:hypothetical protein
MHGPTCIFWANRTPFSPGLQVTSVAQCDPSIVTLRDNRYFTTHGER